MRSKIISQMNDDVSATIRSSYEKTQATYDRLSEARSQTTRGVTPYDAGSGYKVELPSEYSHAWRTDNGQYIVSDNPNYNPNADLNLPDHSSWVEMNKTR